MPKSIYFILIQIIALLFAQTQKMEQKLKILFVTDIHLSFENVEKLFKWHTQHQIKFDLILIGGDTANCDQNGNTHDEQFQEKQANLILTSIQQRFECKMYFIPGNHDPLSFFNEGHFIKNNIISCHQKTVKIADGLQIVGFGGSVPGYRDKERKDEVWKGYPFDSNQALAAQLLSKQIFPPQDVELNNQLIYLTHCGPFNCETSIDRRKLESPIYGGATEYDSLIKHKNLILYIHGHVHNGSRYARIEQLPIINPGPLVFGQFGYIDLRKNEKSNKWEYESSHFIQL